jgi:hypothetical protein
MDARENGQQSVGPTEEKNELQQQPGLNGAEHREAAAAPNGDALAEDGLRDPDFGLSEEERVRIVCGIFPFE